jgi:hypothetical protein
MIKPKKKICKECSALTYIWSKGMCKQCSAKTKGKSLKVRPPVTITYQGRSMLAHTAIYFSSFKYNTGDSYFPSEISGAQANDIHHIIRRGLCGSQADHILNLMALTRQEHEDYGDNKEVLEELIFCHLKFCISKGIDVHLLIDELPDCLNKIKDVYYERCRR